MARRSKWTPDDRKKLLAMVKDGVSEQEIRGKMGKSGKAMTSPAFSQQLKMAMVESGQIKQKTESKTLETTTQYTVTAKGRLTVTDFGDLTGHKPGEKFTLEKPRGRSKAWRLVPAS